jgi:phosphoribosyl-ATP pyrophosphohydrolase
VAALDLRNLFGVWDERWIGLAGRAKLLAKGENEILKKMGEEAVEVIIAAKGESDERVLYELADFLYHTSVFLASRGLTWNDVDAELARRFR